jgi:hypothetical protein
MEIVASLKIKMSVNSPLLSTAAGAGFDGHLTASFCSSCCSFIKGRVPQLYRMEHRTCERDNCGRTPQVDHFIVVMPDPLSIHCQSHTLESGITHTVPFSGSTSMRYDNRLWWQASQLALLLAQLSWVVWDGWR